MGNIYTQIKRNLRKIFRKLEIIDGRLSILHNDLKAFSPPPQAIILSTTPLQRTINALKTLGGSGTATDVAALTGRARAVESLHLNELFRNGITLKREKGREKVFILKEAEQPAEG